MSGTLISAIIPTFHRPDSCVGAVRSVLAQSLPEGVELEAIVVLDGPQPDTTAALDAIKDSRVRVIVLPVRRGHAAARAEGIAHARGEWIAFLDDDDLWFPQKLALQLGAGEAARRNGVSFPVVGCRLEVRVERGSMIWPSLVPRPGQPIGEYLYRKTGPLSLLTGRTLMVTTMLFVPAELARLIPFRAGMRRHADPDWLLRLETDPGVGFVFPNETRPLGVWHLHEHARVSAAGDWRYSLAWARRHREQLGPRATAGFLSGSAAHRASLHTRGVRRVRAFASLINESFSIGRPSVWDLLAFASSYVNAGSLRRTSKRHEGTGA